MYGPTRTKRGEKSGDLNSRKLHKRSLELRSCDLLGGRLALMTTSDMRSVEKRGCEMKSARFRPEFRADTREES